MQLVPCNAKPDGPNQLKILYWSVSCWYANSISIKATVRNSFVNISINNFVFVQDVLKCISSFSSFLRNFDWPNFQNLFMCMMVLFNETNFFKSFRLHFFIKASIDNFWILNWEILNFVALSGNLIGWEIQNVHMYMVILEIPNHLSSKLPIGLPSKSQWTVLSVYKVAR